MYEPTYDHVNMIGSAPSIHGSVLQRAAITVEPVSETVPDSVHDVVGSPGQTLDASTRAFMEPRFGHDFSGVRVHTDGRAAASARSINALAYTVGNHLAFNREQYQPGSSGGQQLLAHELAHVVQQDARTNASGGSVEIADIHSAHEAAADRAAHSVVSGNATPELDPVPSTIQRKVQFRDVGKGEQSGFARLPELINRLNAMPGGLTYSAPGNELAYERREGQELSTFDEQMIEFIDLAAVVPLRLTNRHGLLGSHATGFNFQVEADAWASGYVDIDDLLASSDLGLQFLLVHFIRERAATSNYARRIGSPSLDTNLPGPAAEFNRAHRQGIDAEADLLRGFFGDPTIRFHSESAAEVYRVFRNDRGDRFRARMRRTRNVDAVTIEVRTPDGRILTPEEYLALLEAERTRAQIERERLGGATEHRAGGHSIPAP